jgi:hypothetical protein
VNSIRLSRFLLVGMVVLLTVMPAEAVYAKPPDQETTVEYWDWSLGIRCPGGFEVRADEVVKLHTLVFRDKDDNWIRTKVHYTFDGVWYNSKYPEFYLEENTAHYTITFDEGGETWVGLVQSLQLPDGGPPIFFGAGRLVVDSDGYITFWAGPNDFIDGNFDALCAALSPP